MSYLFSFLFPWLLALWLLEALAIRVWPRLHSAAGVLPAGDASNQCPAAAGKTAGMQGLKPPADVPRWRWRSLLVLGLASAALVSLPAGGIPLGRWLAGLNLPPSLPLLGLLAGRVWRDFAGTELFRAKDRQAAWIFGGLAGTVLYPMALGLGNFDPYAWGWSFSPLFPIAGAAAMYLIWNQNRFGVLLLLSLLAYDARWLESPNFWDCLVDPFYWLLSLALLAKAALKKVCRPETGHAAASE
jgi:hypothetical protein